MFSKLFAVCLIAVWATATVAASIPSGVYRITNAASHSSVRSYTSVSPLYVSSTRENPGPFELFDIQTAPGTSGYTIKSVGLRAYVSAPEEAAGVPLVANGNQEVFSIDSAGGGNVVIKAVNKDLLWTVALPVIPNGNVVLQPSNGGNTQRYILTSQ